MDNFNIYPNTRLGKLVKAKKVEDILDLCDDYCPGQPPEFFFDRSAELGTPQFFRFEQRQRDNAIELEGQEKIRVSGLSV